MITAQLTGGLGNQLFTYAAIKNLARQLGVDIRIDTSIVERVLGHSPDLNAFRLENERQVGLKDLSLLDVQLERVLWKVGVLRKLSKRYASPKLGRDATLMYLKDGMTVRGFFQALETAEQFTSYADGNWFDLKFPSTEFLNLKQESQRIPTIALHVRRGDYAQHKDTFGLLSAKYYREGLDLLKEKFKEYQVWVFSDSPEQVKIELFDQISEFRLIGPTQLNGPETLKLLSLMNGVVTGNSTFSWWGAYMNLEQHIVAPSQWFRSPNEWLSADGLVPSNWLRANSDWVK